MIDLAKYQSKEREYLDVYLINSHEKVVLLKIFQKLRMHQIRIHLATEKLPIIGDDKYGDFAINKIFRAKKTQCTYMHIS